eukprot:CAMPEP_0115882712 /NCGR_PEP_ID=MMETSP0287-20121206/29152_1 /TAXON_ID=412157 /ORGANISM="Chrysochromulina rotalis, Strain UIO044" /LENGTH=173 /DNA_ID=CAMNT_0003338811 /DNA_START=167 /DNA_END=688 /DNA_ORIENTATION=-
MAGFTLTSFVEIDLPPEKRWAKALLHFFVTLSICVNFICVAMVTFVTVWGGGKALRGQDGSMDFAVDEMNSERTFIFSSFGVGVLATLGCLYSAAWVLMEPEIATLASLIIFSAAYMVCSEAWRIRKRFHMDDAESTTFADLHAIFPSLPGSPSRRGATTSAGAAGQSARKGQ